MEFLELMESWGVKPENHYRFVRCPECERSFTSAAVALLHICHKTTRKTGREDENLRYVTEEWVEVAY